jgi:ribonuclease BN (tRNA processing enzyme)
MRLIRLIFIVGVFYCFQCQSQPRTKLVLLGTGTPNVDPLRSGPSTAIIVDGYPYIVDCGPGVVQRAVAAGINVKLLNRLFITHLHSDHTAGYPDFLLTPGVLERAGPLLLFGPAGTAGLNENILEAYQQDIDIRTQGLEYGDLLSYKVEVDEIKQGVVYKDARIEVTAFNVNHGSWPEAFGFKFVTPDKTIVISGDCTYSKIVAESCNGCDILVHEVYSEAGYSRKSEKWQKYHSAFHSSTSQVAKIAIEAGPKILVLNHVLIWDSNEVELLKEIRIKYKGQVFYGKDLDTF